MTSEPAPELIVESGVHCAARCPVPSGRNRVGASPDAAIVVSDLKEAFVLDRGPNGLVLQAVGAPIRLRDGKALKPGRRHRCREATFFSCGDIKFQISVPPAAPSLRGARFSFAGRLFLVPVCVLAMGSVCAVVLSRAAPSLHVPAATVAAIPAAVQALKKQPLRTEAIEKALRQHLDGLGFQSVAIVRQGDDALEATGEIAPEAESAWRQVGRWFDTASEGRVVLVDSVRVTTIVPPLAIRAVWPGRNPYVVDGDGERLFVGSVLSNGWTVDAIGARRVIMKRDGRTVAVTF